MSQEITLPREVLEAPFSEGLVKSRPGAFGGSLSYIEGHTVIARLNEAFDGSWSFDVMSHQILDEEVLVLGRFRSDAAGVVKMAFGSSRITRDSRTGNAIALGDDLKAASTDALKKAATLLGVGLYLYAGANGTGEDDRSFEEELKPRRNGQRGPAQPAGNGRSSNGDGRITNKQISCVFSIARQKGMTNEEVRSLSQETFDRTIDYISKSEASQLIEHLLDR